MKKSSRTIFVWDVQWCFKELKLLMKKLKLKKDDKVYFTGDLINRWPDCYKVLNYLYKNNFRFSSIKGNHEVNFLRWLNWEKYENDSSFKKLKKQIKKHKAHYLVKFIENLPLYIEKKNFIMVHGGIIPNLSLKKHTEDEITRLREYNWKPWYEQYKWEKTVIYGHWAEAWIQIREKTKGLDSGCVYWKALTAYVLETGEIYQQSALDIHVNPYKKKNRWIFSIFN